MIDMTYLYENESVYKVSAFTKQRISIKINSELRKFISLIGYDNTSEKEEVVEITVTITEPISVERYTRNGVDGLLVKCNDAEVDQLYEIFLPNITDYEGVNNAIAKVMDMLEEEKQEKLERERAKAIILREKEELKLKQEEFLLTEYINIKEKYPTYFIDEHNQFSTFIYIDENKGLTIKSIDKKKMESVSSTIHYPAIHYYEKAGNIHYVSKINVEYDNSAIAASFVPSKIKMTPVVIGTLLFGPMGMAAGALLGYEGARFEKEYEGQKSLHISSDTARIDDRSVILNYYSEKNKQYTDIELPHDIYNFLQTHLAEKKYDIVLANEKQTYTNAKGGTNAAISGGNSMMIETSNNSMKPRMSLEDFDIAVKKLKLMKENGLISQEEFDRKKAELMDHIL